MSIVALFQSIGDHIPILKKEKFGQPDPEGIIASFHYRGTCMLIFGFTLLVTCTEWISGSGSGFIECLHTGPIDFINSYCYIMGTFSVRDKYVGRDNKIGYHVAETGVGPYDSRDKANINHKAYYQWVPFMLFLQGVMFYIPHIIYKTFEEGKIKGYIDGLQAWVLDNNERSDKEQALAKNVVENIGQLKGWCLRLVFARALYLVNVVGQILFTDCFLGWEFSTYGASVLSLLELDDEERIDPMSKVFPRVTKCTFWKYGHSGTIQTHDAECVLPINIINEKIFVFLWFWFIVLTVITFINFIFDMILIFSVRGRVIIIKRKLAIGPRRNNLKIDVNLIVSSLDFGVWRLFYALLKNIDALSFREFCEFLTDELQKKKDSPEDENDSCLKLEDCNENINRTSPSGGEFLTLDEIGDGNYVKPKAPSPTGSTHKESSI